VVYPLSRSLGVDPPQWKRASGFQARIYAINQVKAAVVTRADERFFITEGQRIERASKLSKHDLDDDEIPVALFVDGENFGYNGGHMRRFMGSIITIEEEIRLARRLADRLDLGQKHRSKNETI
jgi:hypothetical protein